MYSEKIDAMLEDITFTHITINNDNGDWSVLNRDSIERIYISLSVIYIRTNSGDIIKTPYSSKEEALIALF